MGWSDYDLKVFAGRNSIPLAERICHHLHMPLGEARTEIFPDSEMIVHLEEDVRGRDCFVVLSTCTPVNDNVMELLIFADSLRRASAGRISAVIPYFGYGRQDRKERGRTPITAKLIANLITEAGFDRVLALDLHAAQIQGFFDLPVDHLASAPVFYEYFMSQRDALGDLVVVSPDVGNVKIANMYAEMLDGDLAIVDKRRVSGQEVRSMHIVGDVRGKRVLLVDDMISTGGTVCEAARFLVDHGAEDVTVAATHPVFCGPAIERLSQAPIKSIVVCNTIPAGDRFAGLEDRITELCVGRLFSEAIDHIHYNKSVSALFRQYADSKR